MTEDPRHRSAARWSPLFGLVAPSIGWVPPIRYLLRRRRILRLLGNRPPMRMVEVGCGGGALLTDFSRAGHEVTGVESSPRALALARAVAQASGVSQRLLAQPDECWEERFDIACAFDVLEHIEDDGAAIDQWLSWVRPGGLLCLSVPAHRRSWSAGDEWAGHYRRYDRQDLLGLLAARGLRIEHFECYGFPLANLTEWVGVRTYRRLLAERSADVSRKDATAGSGVDHRDTGLFRRLDTFPGRLGLRAAMLLQAAFARTDLGSGYLVLASKP
ncbi:class I SAM-dependent methyltransferase [Arenimonas fontis]|uniref:Class I SAM-dependent methyltransferase n=1 Tax=Arenimonas fontis TaxID=2608255 RepID=A0A5B2Z862_9GAMM|nr:class I SAM-dependent methyltransferase [Arenimonas fontis]KAA2284928.1 class I SAM-dependent methyltransferase [Arenimonas fontis]